jgi:hypothetical protein
MRKLLISLIAVSGLFAMTASLASSAPPQGKCAQNPIYCAPPAVSAASIVNCEHAGTTLKFPITAHAQAGLKSAIVKFRSTTIKKKSFPHHPNTARFTATLSTRGFRPGLFRLSTTITDTLGKKASRSVHFTICKPKPVFTG